MFKIMIFIGFTLMATINGGNDSNTYNESNTTLYTTYKTTTSHPTQLVYTDYKDNTCVNNSYCLPIVLMSGTVLFIVILMQLCVCCIEKASALDKNERLEHNLGITNPTYEHTDIILIANDDYCEI